ncbi:alcohol dehydrogenase catalytic domain-containing protein [Rhodobacteraceae bacterium NNCM2]|nr:alcohol dehydrogenase catalytic domain-containing protein [Coraliihabitans acroporae]
MKALVYTGPEQIAYRDAADPVPAPGEVRVRVHAVGLCGSDMHAWHGGDERRPPPLILGHEAAGVVEGTGRRVTINPLNACGTCENCRAGWTNICPHRQILSMPPREGCFAEWVTAPEGNLVTVPDDVSFEKASLAEPLACGWHAVSLAKSKMRHYLADAECMVIGGGAIGVGAALALKAQGAQDVTVLETNPVRMPVLDAMPEFATSHPDAYDGQPHLVIDAYGGERSRALASSIVCPGGLIAHIGLASGMGGLDARRMTLQEIGFFGTYTYTDAAFREAAAAIFDGRLGALDWPETRALADGARAFTDHNAGVVAAPKTIFLV